MSTSDAAGAAAMPTTGPTRIQRIDGKVNAALTQYQASRSVAEPYLRLAGLATYLVLMALRRRRTTGPAGSRADRPDV